MRGTNPIRPPILDDGATLHVKAIFPTLQGEGPRAGQPAVFVRLSGCNLACDFCDTEFEEFSAMMVEEIVARVKQHEKPLTVITGGEPLRQNIAPLCARLVEEGLIVQIETNGTLFRELPPEVEIVCSPKYTPGGYAKLRGDLLPRVNAIKFIVSANREDYRDVADVGQGAHATPVYVQPMDEYDTAKNAANAEHAMKLALAHGYKLSLQLHKILGID